MSHVMNTYARLPVAFSHGKGSRVVDTEGREYLDGLSGIAVSTLGHAHPDLLAALSAQAQHIMQILTAELPTKQAAVLAAQISGENKKALYDWALVQKQDKGN